MTVRIVQLGSPRAKDEGVEPPDLAAYATELAAGADAVGQGAGSEGERAVALQLADEAAAEQFREALQGRVGKAGATQVGRAEQWVSLFAPSAGGAFDAVFGTLLRGGEAKK